MANPADQFEFSFTFSDYKIWKNYFLCKCGQEWSAKTAEPSIDGLCPHCLTSCDPYLSDDGSITKVQLKNVRDQVWLRRAFLGSDLGPRVFEDIVNQIYKTKFVVSSSDVIYA